MPHECQAFTKITYIDPKTAEKLRLTVMCPSKEYKKIVADSGKEPGRKRKSEDEDGLGEPRGTKRSASGGKGQSKDKEQE